MKNKIIVIFSSHFSDEQNNDFINHVKETIGVKHEVFCYPNHNEYSLAQIYNTAIIEHQTKDSIMIFCHNDIIFETKEWGKKILKHFNAPMNEFQIIGIAGVTELNSHGCWWLDETRKNMNSTKMIGIVNHDNGIRKWESKYSEPHVGVKPVVLIDGLFMAVDTYDIENNFNENYGKYHFYDVTFSFSNYLDGCNVGVITDVRLTHKSIGETNDEWEINRKKFSEEFKYELPLKIK